MSWQGAITLVLVLLAVAYLVFRWRSRRRPGRQSGACDCCSAVCAAKTRKPDCEP